MPRAYRDCPQCGLNLHVKKNPCSCGHVFVKKVTPPPAVTATVSKAVAPTISSPAYTPDTTLYKRFNELTEYVGTLEKELEKYANTYEERISAIEEKWRKFYAYQAKAIYQRAYEYFGGKGDLYYSKEHGDNPELFKTHADEACFWLLDLT